MLGLQHHDDAGRVQRFHKRIGNLPSQALLHLGAFGEAVHQPRQLRDAADAPVLAGHIGHVRLPEKRCQMVLAHAVERNVAHQHDFLMPLIEGHIEMTRRIFLQAAEHFLVHAGHARRRVQQPLALGVFPDTFQNQADACFDFRCIHGCRNSL